MIWHILFILMVATHEILRRRPYKIDLLTCFNFSFVLSYPLAALALNAPDVRKPYPEFMEPLAVLAIPAYACFWGIFVLAHQSAQRSSTFRAPAIPRTPGIAPDRTLRKRLLYSLAFSVILILVYSHEYGGVERAIRLAGGLRAGFVERGEFSFLKRLLPLPALCAQITLAHLLVKRARTRFLQTMLIAFLALGMTGMLLMAGRARIIFFGIGLLLVYAIVRGRLPKTALLVAGVLGSAILIFGKVFFSTMTIQTSATFGEILRETAARQETSVSSGIAESLIVETSHFYVSLQAAILAANEPESFRLYHDIPVAVVDLIPQALLPCGLPEKVAYLNTYRVLGIRESIVPPGLVAYSLMNMGVLGLFITPVLLGRFTGRMESSLLRHRETSPTVAAAYAVFLLLFGYDILQGEPANFIGGTFVRLAFLGVVYGYHNRPGAGRIRPHGPRLGASLRRRGYRTSMFARGARKMEKM